MTSIACEPLEFTGGDPWARVAEQVRAWAATNGIALRDAIVLLPTDGAALTEAAIAAMDAGIPVINVDREFSSDDAARVTILGDNYGMGVSAGEYICGKLGGKSDAIVAEIAGIDSLPLTQDRTRGFNDALADCGGERRQVDEADEVVETLGGLGDDRTAVGVADQDDRTVDGSRGGADCRRVVGDAAQRVGGRDDLVALGGQLADHAGEPGRVGERAVHQHGGGGVLVGVHDPSFR